MTAITGISSRLGWFGVALQSGKGSAASLPTFKMFFNGAPSLKPYITDARYSMTDGGRDPGDPYVSQIGVQGDVPVYVHPQAIGMLMHAALGANADAGSVNFTHTITPANDLPYLTCFRMVGGVIWEKYTDCKVNSLALSGAAGQPLTAVLNIMGITSTFQTSDPGANPVTDPGYVFMEGAGALKVDTVAYPLHALDFTINNNLNMFQADNFNVDNIDPQGRDISGSYSVRISTATDAWADYRKFFYGADGNTAQTTGFTNHALDFKFVRDANTSLDIAIPTTKYADLPVQPDPGGNVLEVQAAWEAERTYSGGVEGNICTVTVKDQQTTA